MSRCQLLCSLALAGLVFATILLAIADEHEPTTATFRAALLSANAPAYSGRAYEAYFLRVGRAGLKNLMMDENTGIALQAAWETHLKPAQRKKRAEWRTDDVYDPAELAKFVDFFKERTKAPVPDWWATAVMDVDLFPGQHHAFNLLFEPATEESNAVQFVRKDPRIEKEGDNLVCTADGRSVEFPKDTFDGIFGGSFVGLLDEQRSFVAACDRSFGFPYEVAGFADEDGAPSWKADVWAAGRGVCFGYGHHFVEMTEKDGIIYLFGVESHGAYAEAFDAASGKVQFRFSTGYWFNFSEAWELK